MRLRLPFLFLAVLAALPLWSGEPAYRKEGRGPGVLLIHDLGGSRTVWNELVDRLKKNHTLVVVDLPGHGGSAAPALKDGAADLDAVAGDLAQLLRKLKLAPAIVVGHGLGGNLGVRMALADGGAVQGLLLLDATLAPAPAAVTEALTKGLASDPASALRASLGPLAAGAPQTDRVVKEALKVKPEVLSAYVQAAAKGGVSGKGLKVPVQLFASAQLIPDPSQEAEALEKLGLAGIPKFQVQYLVNARHWIMWDEPATFDVLFNDFETALLEGR